MSTLNKYQLLGHVGSLTYYLIPNMLGNRKFLLTNIPEICSMHDIVTTMGNNNSLLSRRIMENGGTIHKLSTNV